MNKYLFVDYALQFLKFYSCAACWWYSALHFELHSLCWWSGRCVQVFFFLRHLSIISMFVHSHISAVWHLNSLSLFDFKRHGNMNYGSPIGAAKSMRSSQGKMEKSLLRYPFQHIIDRVWIYMIVFWAGYNDCLFIFWMHTWWFS
jgi:hypothetical protein